MDPNLEPKYAHEARKANEPEEDHLEMIRRLLLRFGACAERLFDYHDFGFPREAVRSQIASAEAEIRSLQACGSEAVTTIPSDLLCDESRAAWNSRKNLRYAAGALMISSRFRIEVPPAGRREALRLKLLYESFVDTVDDLVDAEAYSFSDAIDLMRHCLESVTAPTFEEEVFREELLARLAPAQRSMTEFLTFLAGTLQRGLRDSPQGATMIDELARFQENWILGEAYTMYQKDPTLDVGAFLTAASRFPAPDPDLTSWERLSGWISHTAALTLIDLCFADRPLSDDLLEEHLIAWFYYDATITLMNNMMDLERDLDNGIANIFLIARKADELVAVRRIRGFRPTLTMKDYEPFLARTAEFARRSLEHARRSAEDGDFFYPFLAVMAPVVMFADETGIREDLLHGYLRAFTPEMRKAFASGIRPAVTIPPGIRSGRSHSARTGSS